MAPHPLPCPVSLLCDNPLFLGIKHTLYHLYSQTPGRNLLDFFIQKMSLWHYTNHSESQLIFLGMALEKQVLYYLSQAPSPPTEI
jgi:hypothetical protein